MSIRQKTPRQNQVKRLMYAPMKMGFIVLSLFLGLNTVLAQAAPAGNTMEVTVGGGKLANMPMVTVTICEPGTNHCQSIPNIELDSGSTGLRIFASLTNLNLPNEQVQGANVAECVQFGGGDVLWGPVKYADVVLGDQTAAHVPIHVADPNYSSVPSACGKKPEGTGQFQANGILGMSPASTDCDGLQCPGTTPGKAYFTCSGKTCEALLPKVEDQVQNPLMMLPSDNNGVVLTFPSVPDEGLPSLVGTMTFGIGTRPNNQPAPSAEAFASDPDGILKAKFNGVDYYTKVDTGTGFWTMPVSGIIPKCASDKTMVCAKTVTDFSFMLVGTDEKVSASVPFKIGNSTALLNSKNTVFSDVAYAEFAPGTFYTPLSFFFGRTVYVGFNGKSTPLGNGPYYGF